jgi:hypothetical protein
MAVVVTGLGATTPLGGDVPTTWEAALAGRSGVRTLDNDWAELYGMPVNFAGQLVVRPEEILTRPETKRMDPSAQMAIVATREAFVGKQTLTQRMLQPALGEEQRSRNDWLKANVASVIFCVLLGGVNLLLAYRVSELAWVRFKLLGLPAAMFVAMLLQLWWLNTRKPATP